MDGPASMGVITCLAELGVPLIGVDFTTHRNYAFKSRFLKQMVILRKDEDLLRLPMAGITGSVLVPVNDRFVAMTSRMKPHLSRHFRVFTPGERVIENCVDKWMQYRSATSLGIPTPETYCPQNKGELERLLESKLSAKGSWVVKPRSRLPEHFSHGVFGNKKAILARNPNQIREICAAVYEEKGVYPLIQEFVSGHSATKVVVNVFLDEDGNALRSMSERKIRSFPPEFGAGSLFETCYEPSLIELAIRFYQGVGFYGQGNVEFIFDNEDKKFKLNEVNPRFNPGVMAHKACGFNSPVIFYERCLGRTVAPRFDYPMGIRSLSAGDVIGIWQNRRQTGLREPIVDMITNLMRIRNFECFSPRDPVPLVGFLLSRCSDAFRILNARRQP
jgi:predicted ATP-grasp superfamily ATP-dependent carboligase